MYEQITQLGPKRRLAMILRTIRSITRGPRPVTFPALTAANLPAMRGRVEILRDRRGIPHIYADHESDLFAALGYLQGADRFAVLDILRHLGSGRMTELIGNFAMPKGSDLFPGRRVADMDLFVRALDFEAQSEREYEQLDGDTRECLDAFAAGMNAALRSMRGVYPADHLLLGPLRPWKPSDALLSARTCALTVALAPLETELIFDAVRGAVGDQVARQFYPEAPWENAPRSYVPTPGPEPEPPIHMGGTGSNNWAVNGARAAANAPVFAADPHVPFLPAPTFWYHAHLECPSYRIQGGLMLGCPIFGYGHNGYLAWGVTTAYRDAWDLARIHRIAGKPQRYRTAAGEGEIRLHQESHTVRFGRDVPLQWESCEHGIIYPGWKHHDGVDLALRYTPSDAGAFVRGYRQLAAAKSVDEHQAALAEINNGPFDFNHLYAHKDGHIAWEPYGRLPRRSKDGLFVRDADDPDAQWQGFLPFSENPKLINPERGYVCSANSYTDPAQNNKLHSATHPEPRYRQDRIEAFLASRTDHSVDTFAAQQRDIGCDYAIPVRDAILELLGDLSGPPEPTAAAYLALRGWDGVFSADSSAASVYALLLRDLVARCFIPLLGPQTGKQLLNSRRAIPRLHRLLRNTTDPLRQSVEAAAKMTLAKLVRAAFEATVNGLVARFGPSGADWAWGKVHRLRVGTVLAEIPGLARYFAAIDAPFVGDGYTVSPSIAIPAGGGLRSFAGATSRFICDLAKPDEGWFAHTTGPSGDIATTYYKEISAGWLNFEYFRSALWKPADVPDVTERLVIEAGA